MEDFSRYTKSYWKNNLDDHDLISNEHRKRTRLGSEKWNEWASKFLDWAKTKGMKAEDLLISIRGIEIKEGIFFDGFRFPCDVDIRDVVFHEGVSFARAKFSGDASFNGTVFKRTAFFIRAEFIQGADFQDVQFLGEVPFIGAIFHKYAGFRKSQFSGYAIFDSVTFTLDVGFIGATFDLFASFNNAVFKGYVSFDDSAFKDVPDFTFASFNHLPHLGSIGIPFSKEGKNVERYRKLKQMAIQQNDYASEVKYFGYETHAKAYLESTPWYNKSLFKLYHLTSDFGLSIAKPFVTLLVYICILFVINLTIIQADSKACRDSEKELQVATLTYTLSEALPIMNIGDEQAKEIKKCLFGEKPLGLYNNLWRLVHLVPSAFLLFLFGLGIRNRFKIK